MNILKAQDARALQDEAATLDVPLERSGDALHVQSIVVPLPDEPLRVSDWRIDRGDKVALIGRNGVGKSSLTEAILGLRSGVAEGRLLGEPFRRWRRKPGLRRRLGVQLQRVFFPGRPRISELVALHRTLYPRTSARVIEALGIDALSHRLYEFLSRGETQRVDLFLALAHEPEILFLDEPYTGLDAQFSRRLGELLRELRETTLIMCCHTVEELSLTTHTAWLSRQGIVRHAETDRLRRELVGEHYLTVHCSDEAAAAALGERLHERTPKDYVPQYRGEVFTLRSAQALTELAKGVVESPEVVSVDFGRTQFADLLRHCSRSA